MSADYFELGSKTALVTGASSGLGRHFARVLADAGAAVGIAARRTDRLETLAQEIAEAGGTALPLAMDVNERASIAAGLERFESELGAPDILINNAGVSGRAAFLEATDDQMSKVFDTNFKGAWAAGQETAKRMVAAGNGGAIVNTASINGIRGNNRMVAYAASKGGVVAMTMSLALDHVGDNIRVNCVCPATIDTQMVADMLARAPDLAAANEAIVAKHPIGRMAEAAEVGSVIAFLASDDASFMTGLAIPVDGGRSVR